MGAWGKFPGGTGVKLPNTVETLIRGRKGDKRKGSPKSPGGGAGIFRRIITKGDI